MASTISQYLKVVIYLALFCTLIQIGHSQPVTSLGDTDDEQSNVESSLINNYAALLTAHLNGKMPLDEFVYQRQAFNPEHVQLGKRLIMLPRVGRRST